MTKLESKTFTRSAGLKDYPISLACYESTIYNHINGQVLLRFSCSDFVLLLFYMCSFSLLSDVSRVTPHVSNLQGYVNRIFKIP
jgi:hypothetical protein